MPSLGAGWSSLAPTKDGGGSAPMGRNRFVMLVLSNVDVCVPEAADIAIPSPDSFLRNSTATVLLCLTTIEHQTLAPLKLPLEPWQTSARHSQWQKIA